MLFVMFFNCSSGFSIETVNSFVYLCEIMDANAFIMFYSHIFSAKNSHYFYCVMLVYLLRFKYPHLFLPILLLYLRKGIPVYLFIMF